MSNKPMIICVDDEIIVLNSLSNFLIPKFPDYNFEFAESAEEAIEIFNDGIQNNIEIPILISDYLMPIMTGDELIIKVSEISPDTKNILLTGQATMDGVINTINNGYLYRYIEKPWDAEDLLLTINEALNIYYTQLELDKSKKELEVAYEDLKSLDNAKTYFLGILSHELHTPLTGISGFAQLINQLTEDKEILECANGIITSEKRLRRFSDIALLITRIKTNTYKFQSDHHNLLTLINYAHTRQMNFASERGFTYNFNFEKKEYLIKCDDHLITEALSLIFNNAIKFTEYKKGILDIDIIENDNEYILSLKDNGIGIQEDRIESIFNAFESDNLMNHSDGYGLGLTAVKMILNVHNYSIKASRLKVGSVFTIKIPKV